MNLRGEQATQRTISTWIPAPQRRNKSPRDRPVPEYVWIVFGHRINKQMSRVDITMALLP